TELSGSPLFEQAAAKGKFKVIEMSSFYDCFRDKDYKATINLPQRLKNAA
ncbi:MAG: hypothetical protein ACI94O_001243, partial [Octadecabacter sp.]